MFWRVTWTQKGGKQKTATNLHFFLHFSVFFSRSPSSSSGSQSSDQPLLIHPTWTTERVRYGRQAAATTTPLVVIRHTIDIKDHSGVVCCLATTLRILPHCCNCCRWSWTLEKSMCCRTAIRDLFFWLVVWLVVNAINERGHVEDLTYLSPFLSFFTSNFHENIFISRRSLKINVAQDHRNE